MHLYVSTSLQGDIKLPRYRSLLIGHLNEGVLHLLAWSLARSISRMGGDPLYRQHNLVGIDYCLGFNEIDSISKL